MLSRFPVVTVAVLAGSVASAADTSSVELPSSVSAQLRALAAKQASSASASPAATSTLVTRAGYVDLSLAGIVLSSAPPAASRKLFCSFVIYAATSSYTYRETTVPATINGNSFSCSTKLAYKWDILPSSSLYGAGGVFAVDTSLSVVEAAQYFNGGVSVVYPETAPFPASGATTTMSKTGLIF
jgi:hypothetical protein